MYTNSSYFCFPYPVCPGCGRCQYCGQGQPRYEYFQPYIPVPMSYTVNNEREGRISNKSRDVTEYIM